MAPRRPLLAAALALLPAAAFAADAPTKTLVFEAEAVSGPADAWEKDKPSASKWNLWSTDADERERRLAEQAERAYERLAVDWGAAQARAGAGATPGRAS